MGERRSFSRSPRKALSQDARQRLISAILDEEYEDHTLPLTEIPPPERAEAGDTFSDSLDRLDAFDAQPLALEDELREPEPEPEPEAQAEAAPEPAPPQSAAEAEAFEALLAAFDSEDIPRDTEDREDGEDRAAPLDLSDALLSADHQPAPEADTSDLPAPPEPEADREPDPEPEPLRTTEEAAKQERLRAAYQAEAPALHREPADKWDSLDVMPVDAKHLEQNLVITASRNEPAHGAFDVLRTRLVQTLLEHNWKRVAITSPTRNCGKTFTSVNLAISLSRYEATRTILMDFDMRNPSVAGVIGDTRPGRMGDFLRGTVSAEELLVRFDTNTLNIGAGLAIGTNHVVEPYASELAHEPATRASLERMMEEMSPDIVLFDMPPALAFDDVIAFRQHFDGVLMVVSGGETRPDDVREVMRRMGEETPLLGVVLNQAEGEDGSDYSYGN
ncbi:exopolysaccharide biosynthesis protein [uncultured Lentibacter sp.]|uniref:CpsD/CapB family tyrosine-protein kinase n=1 Tax=uncultured Lentibacter sp. TaxID=1659309 RepID=UPI00262888A3|nr:exopolysaccharide biosynthesis protein [uncultured Lentibacter sp.]